MAQDPSYIKGKDGDGRREYMIGSYGRLKFLKAV
jgi:hypothetical protein